MSGGGYFYSLKEYIKKKSKWAGCVAPFKRLLTHQIKVRNNRRFQFQLLLQVAQGSYYLELVISILIISLLSIVFGSPGGMKYQVLLLDLMGSRQQPWKNLNCRYTKVADRLSLCELGL